MDHISVTCRLHLEDRLFAGLVSLCDKVEGPLEFDYPRLVQGIKHNLKAVGG